MQRFLSPTTMPATVDSYRFTRMSRRPHSGVKALRDVAVYVEPVNRIDVLDSATLIQAVDVALCST
jgi:hypothetical protein